METVLLVVAALVAALVLLLWLLTLPDRRAESGQASRRLQELRAAELASGTAGGGTLQRVTRGQIARRPGVRTGTTTSVRGGVPATGERRARPRAGTNDGVRGREQRRDRAPQPGPLAPAVRALRRAVQEARAPHAGHGSAPVHQLEAARRRAAADRDGGDRRERRRG